MTTPRHTPGPWVVHTFTISGKEKLEVLDATGTNACVQANAHLIAAAPAMYEALQKISDLYRKAYESDGEFFLDESEIGSLADAALAQAEDKP